MAAVVRAAERAVAMVGRQAANWAEVAKMVATRGVTLEAAAWAGGTVGPAKGAVEKVEEEREAAMAVARETEAREVVRSVVEQAAAVIVAVR